MKILKYQFVCREINHGTDENPDIEQVIAENTVKCPDDLLEANLAIYRKDAINGEVTVEDIPMTADEARAKRDELLEASDWTQVLDAPIDETTKSAYRAYRQALRDVPQQDGFPEVITWPELPTKVKADPEPVDEAVELLLSGATGEEAST